MRKITLLASLLFLSITIFSQNENIKKILDDKVYNSWKTIKNQKISDDGNWITYEIDKQKEDGFLYLYNVKNQTLDSISRGKNALFSSNSDFMVFQIKVQYDTLRALNLKKTPKSKLPKDSLGIWILSNDSIIKIPNIKSYETSQKNISWLSYIDETVVKAKQETPKKKKFRLFKEKQVVAKTKEIKQKGDNTVLFNPITNTKIKFDKADESTFDNEGNAFFVLTVTDLEKGQNSKIIRYDLHNKNTQTIFNDSGNAVKISANDDGSKMAFLFAKDTAKTNKIYGLYEWLTKDSTAKLVVDTITSGIKKGWSPSINGEIYYTKKGGNLFFGTAPNSKKEPKDTLLPEEKYHLDVWNYNDEYLQSEQKVNLKKDLERTYLAIWNSNKKTMIQLEDSTLNNVEISGEGLSKFALGIDDKKYRKEQSWNGWFSDYYVVNITNGDKELILEHQEGSVNISPNGKYIVYYKFDENAWYSYNINTKKHTNLTTKLNIPFYNEKNDMPTAAEPYGIDSWSKDDKYIVIKDYYDLWKIDPEMKVSPINLTANYGRTNKIRFSSIYFNTEDYQYFDNENPHYLKGFNDINKSSGYYKIDINKNEVPKLLIQSNHRYYNPIKSKNTDLVIFRRSSFIDYPNLNLTDTSFSKIKQISNTNPQQKEYNWGTSELVNWIAFDGQKLQGILYKPENFDSTKTYPMVIYFYERFSDNLNNYISPQPTYSSINFIEYVSNGYIVFLPDVTYKIGHPAKSAYNAIVSGTEYMKTKPWIDAKHIGIQGQSWGGYQVGMLVTMTDIYACASAGAPVSDMISAYGGIRWESGMNRAFQYEKTQSRIGVPLWDNIDLYIENSPIFFVPKIKTPLLIMSNDADGAVPWYQGIEYFTALRRLNKPAWMLSYNQDGHNLMKWPNRVDLSIRLMQFFNHYLKDTPMPIWMADGIPATEKGKTNGYELKTETKNKN